MIDCYDCEGNGYTVFYGNESICRFCKGVGQLTVCDTFSISSTSVVAFRNQKCCSCGVKQTDHTNIPVNS